MLESIIFAQSSQKIANNVIIYKKMTAQYAQTHQCNIRSQSKHSEILETGQKSISQSGNHDTLCDYSTDNQ